MSADPPPGGGPDGAARLIGLVIDEASIERGTPDQEHERAVAIYDLLEGNSFALAQGPPGPYRLRLGLAANRLLLDVRDVDDAPLAAHALSLGPFRRVVKDYFMICESYFEAIRGAHPERIEAIDMGRRGVHDEGAGIVAERLAGKVDLDHDTARRLFTLICALSFTGR